MGLLGKEELLKRDELTIKKVEFSNGDFVYVREMTGRERDTFERSLLKEVKRKNGEVDYERNLEDFRAKLAASTICDENGDLLLKFNEHPKLSQSMSASKLEKIVNIAQKINSITEDDKEGLVKNSEGDQKGNSTSDSVAN